MSSGIESAIEELGYTIKSGTDQIEELAKKYYNEKKTFVELEQDRSNQASEISLGDDFG